MSVPSEATAGWAEKRLALSLLTWKTTVCPASSAGPGLIPVAQPLIVRAPESSSTESSGPLTKLGGSLTDATVMETVAVALVSDPSLAW